MLDRYYVVVLESDTLSSLAQQQISNLASRNPVKNYLNEALRKECELLHLF